MPDFEVRTKVLLTRLPLYFSLAAVAPFDLHALSTPPAFVLDQDQILKNKINWYAFAKKAKAKHNFMFKLLNLTV